MNPWEKLARRRFEVVIEFEQATSGPRKSDGSIWLRLLFALLKRGHSLLPKFECQAFSHAQCVNEVQKSDSRSIGFFMQDDLFLDDDENNENIYDSEASESDLRNAVLYHTDWTVETLVSQIKKGRIELSPEFQRREAWTLKAKSLLIESIILNFPIPAITLAERDGRFIVVDGKQRLTTIAQYLGEMPGTRYNGFKLSGLAQLKNLNGQNYLDLAQSSSKDASSLENYPIRTNGHLEK